ncbi:hypothetical protein H0H93_013913, partial [Arthromyces matolae]
MPTGIGICRRPEIMPPRTQRGSQRGGKPPRGPSHVVPQGDLGFISSGANVTTIGLKRPNFGTSGRAIAVVANCYVAEPPHEIIRHYDAFTSNLHPRIRRLLLKQVEATYPNVFTKKIAFDGRQNAFSPFELPLGPSDTRSFDVTLNPQASPDDRPPRVYTVKFTKVKQINPEVLKSYVNGRHSFDEDVAYATM